MSPSLRRGASGRGAALAAAVLGAAAVALVAASDRIAERWWLLVVALVLAAVVETVTEASAGRARARSATTEAGAASQAASHSGRASAGVGEGAPPSSGTSEAPSTPLPPGARVNARTRPPAPPRRRPPGLSGDGIVLSKSTAHQGECDDSCQLDLGRGLVAVSDGASSAFMSSWWSEVLTTAYVADPPEHELTAVRRWVAECSDRWNAHLGEQVAPTDADWWNEASARRGSFATFLGLRIGTDEITGHVCWDALAVGDSCLVQVRPSPGGADQLVCSFPLETSHAFGGNPELVPTADAESAAPVDLVRTATGNLRPGDSLLVMTDALAQWALAQHEAGTPRWTRLLEVSRDGLAELVNAARSDASMVDDDVTLVRLGFEAPGADDTIEVPRLSAAPLSGAS